MKETKTKEQMVEEIATLKHQNEQYLLNDQIRRREFSKAFMWFKMQQPYSYRNDSNEPQLPTWEQIFVNIGFLTAQRDFRNYEGNISELEVAVEEIKKSLTPPKTNL